MSEWRARAACLGTNADFYPDQKDPKYSESARKICNGSSGEDEEIYRPVCPVKAECLAWALSQGDTKWGVWGGLTPEERTSLVRRRKREREKVSV